mgnify:CR=1 FL=1
MNLSFSFLIAKVPLIYYAVDYRKVIKLIYLDTFFVRLEFYQDMRPNVDFEVIIGPEMISDQIFDGSLIIYDFCYLLFS